MRGPAFLRRRTCRDDAVTPLELSTTAGPYGEMLVVARGELDLRTGPALLIWLDGVLSQPCCQILIVDLSRVRFLGAHGIGVLQQVRDEADAHEVRFAVVAEHRAVLRPLQLTATSARLALFSTVAEARVVA